MEQHSRTGRTVVQYVTQLVSSLQILRLWRKKPSWLSLCLFQDIVVWSNAPSYTVESSYSRRCPIRVYKAWTGLSDLVTLKALHFSGWKAMQHFFPMLQGCWDHMVRCRMAVTSILLIHLYRMQSSPKSLIFDWTHFGRSFLNKNKRCPYRTVPCGTPLKTWTLFNVAPSTVICCARSVRKSRNHARVLPLTP